jgi:cytochrome c553
MVHDRFPTVFGALVILAAPLAGLLTAPANAAEAIEGKLQICSSCHGENGVPINAVTPTIWGQQEYFLVKQLHDFKSGDRENQIMSSMAATLTQADLRPAARYFAAKPWPARTTPAAATPAPNGTAVCRICHQPNFEGGLPAPRLAGQSYEYLVQAMHSFADGRRTNNADMVKLMQERTAEEREAIARYLAGL